jgi:hypothetical protein
MAHNGAPMKAQDIFNYILYIVVLPFSAISFILTPLTNDTRIFLGAEAIADTFYKLPYGWDAAYEVKPVGNRIINWIFYKVGNTFVPFIQNDYVHFGWFVKATALIILILCCWYISRKIVFPYSFPFLFLAFVCQANFGILMAEWFSVLFSLVAVSLCMEENKNYTIAAGALCLCIALIKSITVLMVIPTICAIYLLDKEIDWKRFAAGYISAGFAFLICCLTIWPYSIGDMLMSRLVAHVGLYDLGTILVWFWITQDRSSLPVAIGYYMPILAIGFVAAVMMGAVWLSKRDTHKLLLLMGIWVIPITIVLIQSEFIVYHYLVLMLPAIMSVVVLTRGNTQKQKMLVMAAITVLVAAFIVINSVFGSFTRFEYTFWEQKEINANVINADYNLTNQSSILYMDPGDAPFYFHANSSCHYITPMPVERSTTKWDLSYLPQYNETLKCILSYQGEYIIADLHNKRGFFGEGIITHPEIMPTLERNYTIVKSLSWDIYKRKVNSF